MNLAFLTATHWRPIRRRLAAEGIGDPMSQFPHMHALLDATEAIVLESFVDPKNPKRAEAERDRFIDSLYRPDPVALRVADDGFRPPPAGFEDGGDDTWDWGVGTGAE